MGTNLFQSAVDEYLAKGGEIKHVPMGERGVASIKTRDPEVIHDIDDSGDNHAEQHEPNRPMVLGDIYPEIPRNSRGLTSQPKSERRADLKIVKTSWHDAAAVALPPGCKWVIPGAIYSKRRAA